MTVRLGRRERSSLVVSGIERRPNTSGWGTPTTGLATGTAPGGGHDYERLKGGLQFAGSGGVKEGEGPGDQFNCIEGLAPSSPEAEGKAGEEERFLLR